MSSFDNSVRQQILQRKSSLSALAREAGVNKASVSRWLSRRVPAERVLQVEKLTGISRQVLRPDLYAPALLDAPVSESGAVDAGRHPVKSMEAPDEHVSTNNRA